ncbi:MAG TPA: TetR/AcrR family transcriptional regulator [Rhizomicrobium sp.]
MSAAQATDLKEISSPDDKRARLLAAALELFETRGFDGVAVPEIAAKAGVATGTIYRYFTTKEALVNALYRYWKAVYNAIVLAPLPQGLETRDQFTTYWQRMMQFAQNHPRATRFMDLHHHAPYLDAGSIAAGGTYREVAEAFIGRARDSGAIRDIDPILVVALMWGAAVGLTKFAGQGALTCDAATAIAMEEALWRAIAND